MTSTDGNLTLTNPTDGERILCWKGTHPLWGAALTLDGYLEREGRQLGIPLARDGGLTNWILTESGSPEDSRPVYSSCETLKKRVLIRDQDGAVREGIAHGVASVFTDPQHRGKGHAGTMMKKLAQTFAQRETEKPGHAVFSVLYSDIGKKFYNVNGGWKPYASNHIEFPASSTASAASSSITAKPIFWDDLPPLVAADEALVRAEIAKPSSPTPSATRIAIIPDLDHIHWHLYRENFVCDSIFGSQPSVRGAQCTTPSGIRIWSIWTRSYSGTAAQPEKNTLYFLRLVVEEGDGASVSDAELREALGAMVAMARNEADQWKCAKVQMWNPEARLRAAAEALDQSATYVERESDSIAALNAFGNISESEIDWVTNEKYGWC